MQTEGWIHGSIRISLENQEIANNSSSVIKMKLLEFLQILTWLETGLALQRQAVMTCNPIRHILPSDRALQPSGSVRAGATDHLTSNKTGLEGGIWLLQERCEREDICHRCRDAGNRYKHSILQKLHLEAFLLGAFFSCPRCRPPFRRLSVPSHLSKACKDLREDPPRGSAWPKGCPRGSTSQGDTATFEGFNKIYTTPYSHLGLTTLLSDLQLKGVRGRSLGIPHIIWVPRIPVGLSKLFGAFFGQRPSITRGLLFILSSNWLAILKNALRSALLITETPGM